MTVMARNATTQNCIGARREGISNFIFGRDVMRNKIQKRNAIDLLPFS
jgi:hypothetical protein